MSTMIKGPKTPPKAFENLVVRPDKAWNYEGLFDRYLIGAIKLFFDPSGGYFYLCNKDIYDAIWQGVFQSLTGESLTNCLIQTLLSEEDYLPYIEKTFGSIEKYKKAIGHHPTEVHGVNLEGVWIISRDKKDLGLLADEFHEFGHRAYPNSVDGHNRELGANYFMFLALQKTNIELNPHGISLPEFDFGEQITDNHEKSLQEARRLVTSKTEYVHKSH